MGTRPQLLLTYDFPPMGGGIARWMGELALRFEPGSLVVSTGQTADSRISDSRFPNRIERLPVAAERLRTIQGLLLWSRRVATLAHTLQANFIWCGNLKPAGYPAKWAQTRAGTPYGILLHGGDLLILQHQLQHSILKRRAARSLLGSASVLVANSRWTRDLCHSVLDQLECEVPPHGVRVVPLGADPVQFRPGLDQTVVRARYGLDSRTWLLSIARLTRHKGIDTALHVLALLREKHPDLGYLVVGSGDDLMRLKHLTQSLGLGDRVRFLTNVPDQDLPALYNCAAVYLGLSRLMDQRVEGFGISLVEAAACGLPVVAGQTGGIPEAVQDQETGLLVAADDPEQICAAVQYLLADRERAAKLGAAGRALVERYYNWDRVTRDLDDLGQTLGRMGRTKVATL